MVDVGLGMECTKQCNDQCKEHMAILKSLAELKESGQERQALIKELQASQNELNEALLKAITELNEKIGDNIILINNQIHTLQLKQQQDSFRLAEYVIALLISFIGGIAFLFFTR